MGFQLLGTNRTRQAVTSSVLYELLAILVVGWLLKDLNVHDLSRSAAGIVISLILLAPGSIVLVFLLFWVLPSSAPDWVPWALLIAMALVNVTVLAFFIREYLLPPLQDSPDGSHDVGAA